METKFNFAKAQKVIKNINFPNYIPPEENWLLWKYSSDVWLEIISNSNRFIHCYIRD